MIAPQKDGAGGAGASSNGAGGGRRAPVQPLDLTGGLPASVNDVAFKIATVNGTGSASANGLIMKTIFRMGIPVSGKNLFPSNIQGLPTWYEIRVNGRGHTARTPDFDLMLAMNPATYARDVAEVRPGGWLMHDATWPLPRELARDDLTFLGVPLARMCNERFEGARARILLKNICYAGVLAALLELDLKVMEQLLEETYGYKKKLLDSNFEALALGHDYATEHFACPLPRRLEAMDETKDAILVDGNTAAALGCVYAGATVAGWYPITPSTSLIDAFKGFCDEFRKDEQGRNTVAIVQAEDELAAAGMVIGANWVGARGFTATSGPGISLMSEFIGLAYYAEIPSVFFNIQRTGPSTGMPTRTQQGDLMLCAYASHGDTKHLCLYPANPAESFDMAVAAFDLAERFQTPVFVVQDLDIGMNDWVVPKLKWDDAYRPDRGKVLTAQELEELTAYYRYLDQDGDGVAARTLPGVHPKGAFFTRGSGHDRYGRYTEDSAAYVDVMERLLRKVDGAAAALPEPEVVRTEGATWGMITVGGCRGAVLEAREALAEAGVAVDVLRVRGFPFHESVEAFIEGHARTFVVEQNRDAQLHGMLLLETEVEREKLASIRQYGGMPLSAVDVVEGVAGWLEEWKVPGAEALRADEARTEQRMGA